MHSRSYTDPTTHILIVYLPTYKPKVHFHCQLVSAHIAGHFQIFETIWTLSLGVSTETILSQNQFGPYLMQKVSQQPDNSGLHGAQGQHTPRDSRSWGAHTAEYLKKRDMEIKMQFIILFLWPFKWMHKTLFSIVIQASHSWHLLIWIS